MARPSTTARRYAEAAFQIALRDGTVDRWAEAVDLASALLADEQVAAIVDNPAIPLHGRITVVDRLLSGRVPPGALNLVRLLVQRGRIEQLPKVASEFRRLLNRMQGVVEAVVTSAAPLTSDEVAALRARLAEMTRGEVALQVKVDDALIGGLTVRVGDQLVDASVRGRLERLRAQLVAGARSAH
jgi:F-type H+-transporting ATPase subunit delta